MKTPQDVFDETVRHLAAQGGPSMRPKSLQCAYEGAGGRKCAVGFWLKYYAPSFEGRILRGTMGRYDFVLKNAIKDEACFHLSLLADLQSAHDNASRTHNLDWLNPREASGIASNLQSVAIRHGLSQAAIKEAWS